MTMQWRSRVIVLGLTVGILALAGQTAAQGSKAGGAKRWWQNAAVLDQVGLTATQVDEITQLYQEHNALAEAAANERRDAWQALKNAAVEDPSGDEFKAAADTYQRVSSDLAALSVDRLKKLAAIVGPEQLSTLGSVAPSALAPGFGTTASGGGLRSASSPVSGQ